MVFRFNGVSERDMDILFMEEFVVNDDFLRLFTQKITDIDLAEYKVVSEEVSYVDTSLGESDLTIVLEYNGHKVALLIEDKINAVAQPMQYERYVERGNKGVDQALYNSYYVFLIAPAGYLENNDSAAKYPLKVTYEECRDLLEAQKDARSRLKYQQLVEAIEEGHKPYTKVVDNTSTSFWRDYVRYMQTYYPDIELKSNVLEKSKKGDWPTYKTCLDMKSVYIQHKMKMKGVEYSNIDLTFNGLAEHREQLKELLKQMLGENYDSQFGVHKAGKSAVLRLVAPKCLDWQLPFEEQTDTADEHLSMVSKLMEATRHMDKGLLLDFYEKYAPDKKK